MVPSHRLSCGSEKENRLSDSKVQTFSIEARF